MDLLKGNEAESHQATFQEIQKECLVLTLRLDSQSSQILLRVIQSIQLPLYNDGRQRLSSEDSVFSLCTKNPCSSKYCGLEQIVTSFVSQQD